MDTGDHKFFYFERDEIQTLADRFEGGTDRARMVLQEMLLHGTGLPADLILDCAAAYLFATSSGWQIVNGPSKITILPDRFNIRHVDRDMEKKLRYWEAKLNGVPAEAL